MANILNGNTYYVDTVSSSVATALAADDVSLLGIIYHTDSANQHLVLNDINGQSAAGSLKIQVGNLSAHETVYLDFSNNPIRFPKGIWISTLDSGVATLIVKLK